MRPTVSPGWRLLGYEATLEWHPLTGLYRAYVAEITHLEASGSSRARALRRLARLLRKHTH